MDRRHFLRVTGLVAATAALGALPAAPAAASTLEALPSVAVNALMDAPRLTVTRLAMRTPGQYQVTGVVRLESPTVEISGIANSQQISWSGSDVQTVRFSSFEQYDGTGLAPQITVVGGKLESLSVTPIDYV